ncbi:MAG: ABC transporter permease [Burkholderiales bacterium]
MESTGKFGKSRLFAGFSDPWTHRRLLAALVVRDIASRYQGSRAGLAWALLHPLVMLAIYTFVFSEVFALKWRPGNASPMEFALFLFAGLIVFNIFAEVVGRAPTLVLSHPHYVKRVVFPLHLLVWVSIGTALFHGVAGFAIWLAFHVLHFGVPPLSLLQLPLVILPLILLTAGVGFLLAALGVFLRDVGQAVSVCVTGLMFLSPVFYPLAAVPAEFTELFRLNPMTTIIENARAVMILGDATDWANWLSWTFACSLVAIAGSAGFEAVRGGFADAV